MQSFFFLEQHCRIKNVQSNNNNNNKNNLFLYKYKLILEFLHKVFSSVVNSVNGHILYILQVIRYKTFLCVYIYSEWGLSYEHLVNEYNFILGSLICLQAFWISNQAIIFSIAQQNVDNIFALLLFFLRNAIILFFRTTLQNKKCTVK